MKHTTISVFGCALAVALAACQATPEYDTTLSENLQDEREKLTVADAYSFGDINKSGSSKAIAVTFLSSGMSIVYDGIALSGYQGNGYAFDIIFNTVSETTLDTGIYVLDSVLESGTYSYAPGTIHPANSTLSIVHDGISTALSLSDAEIKVAAKGDGYTVDFAVTTSTGVAIEAHFVGEIVCNDIYSFREPSETTTLNDSLVSVVYEASPYNYQDWLTDSMYSFYADYYAAYAEYVYENAVLPLEQAYAEEIELYLSAQEQYEDSASIYESYADSLEMVTTTADSVRILTIMAEYENAYMVAQIFNKYAYYVGMYEDLTYYAAYYTKAYETSIPDDLHTFELATEQGDVIYLEVALGALSPEYHAVLPDGKYLVEAGVYYPRSTSKYRAQSSRLYGSYIQAADGNLYYVAGGEIEVSFVGNTVASLHFKGETANGSVIDYSFTSK
ncbi:MAG: hypothetical protein ACI3Z8_04510 [Paludibacteraceae bacterium]